MPEHRDAPEETPEDELESAVGARVDETAAREPDEPPAPGTSPDAGPTPSDAVEHGGFLKRLAAYAVDSLVIAIPTSIVLQLIGVQPPATDVVLDAIVGEGTPPAGLLVELAKVSALLYVVQWPYFAGFEASSWQATPGKRLLGLAVTDEAGARLSFPRATGRYFGKVLSEVLLALGYLMILVTERKQGLHDKLAGTLVVER